MGDPLEPGADKVLQDLRTGRESQYLKLIKWKDESDFEARINEVLVQELGLANIQDVENFNKRLGSSDGQYFNRTVQG